MNEGHGILRRIRDHAAVFDPTLSAALALLVGLSMLTMYSAAMDFPGRFEGHVRNLLISLAVLWIAANIPPTWMMRSAVPLYLIGIALLVAVALFGDVSKGARRWLNLGFGRIQPSELLKIAVPLMLAWYFQRREGGLRWFDWAISALLLVVPAALILRQPDLGTALLVLSAGGFVIFLAGLNWKAIALLAAGAVASAPLLWSMMHGYQRQRVLTLLDPSSDPLGRGFHIIQSTIAVGSGGIWGKGWLQGTQTHLEFIPERTTDFILAAFAEEFGLAGNAALLIVYLLLISRGLFIAAQASSEFARLFAGAITLIFFTYAFVNIGMVTGIVPVVGVPLPMMSYGGTAMLTLGLGAGLLMSIHRHRSLVQT
ncbi:MAG: rod shape-determining protein RodA [Burkholderiaceae bacterium]|nr:rod shape-determining protein RodA [Burkholderiaceae bacterium]